MTALQDRIAEEGLFPEERQSMLRAGASEADVDSFVATFLTEDYEGLGTVNYLDAISEYRAVRVENEDLRNCVECADYVYRFYHAQGYLAWIPTADAGGPYSAVEGSPMELAGSGSSPNGPVTFSWDLDGDGDFDDLSEPVGSVTYDREGQYLAVLKVTDPLERTDLSVALVEVENLYDPPRIESLSPPMMQPPFDRQASAAFEVVTQEPAAFEWFLNEELVGADDSLSLATENLPPGVHWIRASVRNPEHAAASVDLDWNITVLPIEVSPDSFPTTEVSDSGADHELFLRNPGEEPVRLVLSAYDSTETAIEWVFFDADTIDLAPGVDSTVTVFLTCVGMEPDRYGGFVDIRVDDIYGSHLWIPLSMIAACSEVSAGPGEILEPILTLDQNYPNPFNPVTTIHLQVPRCLLKTRIIFFDVSGREVRTIDLGRVEPGTHRVTWDGLSDQGEPVGSGIYFYRLVHEAGASRSRKAIILR
jgi:hypothetical protein